ncbi:MAG: signal recognition particle-docking protein FtsY [Spirochaetales bacterium]|uniref:signal recognition particle-docking protein FtsY n=1 Tax=Bullifex sp. TaxID=2815808 RepID=UPI002A545D1E|nr:signal recognition particle-docking protein FtsY [Bullifex sp.]MDD5974034.1 signal recognition particle-docking protein FtsY [Spirochaetales bacterium]MDD7271147.1 signal recognition particle-docking protein FtsY [Spirochaetales bacterium]MDY4067233.1 signal recognition particle-docking protein FtsY [Bullifex sp.]
MFKKFKEKLKSLFTSRKIDEAFFEELEDTLIEGDLGARLTDEVIETLRKAAKEERAKTVEDLQLLMKDILSPYVNCFDFVPKKGELTIFLVLGVNGVGKTTSIAKIAQYYVDKGYKVMLAAADTFRAAAVDQLDIHADRLGIRIVKQKTGSDPGAVVYDAITSAQSQGDEIILVDTAGRMHNKENLMRELQKINKIIANRGVKEENYKKLIVIDSTTGQNGLSQTLLFNEAVKVDGVILSKYDSAAKGGALVQIGQQLGLPVAFVGTGETYKDIHPFDKEEFLNALVGKEN